MGTNRQKSVDCRSADEDGVGAVALTPAASGFSSRCAARREPIMRSAPCPRRRCPPMPTSTMPRYGRRWSFASASSPMQLSRARRTWQLYQRPWEGLGLTFAARTAPAAYGAVLHERFPGLADVWCACLARVRARHPAYKVRSRWTHCRIRPRRLDA